jgi:hypothetical protein
MKHKNLLMALTFACTVLFAGSGYALQVRLTDWQGKQDGKIKYPPEIVIQGDKVGIRVSCRENDWGEWQHKPLLFTVTKITKSNGVETKYFIKGQIKVKEGNVYLYEPDNSRSYSISETNPYFKVPVSLDLFNQIQNLNKNLTSGGANVNPIYCKRPELTYFADFVGKLGILADKFNSKELNDKNALNALTKKINKETTNKKTIEISELDISASVTSHCTKKEPNKVFLPDEGKEINFSKSYLKNGDEIVEVLKVSWYSEQWQNKEKKIVFTEESIKLGVPCEIEYIYHGEENYDLYVDNGARNKSNPPPNLFYNMEYQPRGFKLSTGIDCKQAKLLKAIIKYKNKHKNKISMDTSSPSTQTLHEITLIRELVYPQ